MMKTIEEQAGDYAWILRRHIRDISGEKATLAYEAFLAGAKAATRWIPVEEELPTEGNVVLGFLQGLSATVTVYYDIGKKAFYRNTLAGGEMKDISHWLPVPPEPGK